MVVMWLEAIGGLPTRGWWAPAKTSTPWVGTARPLRV